MIKIPLTQGKVALVDDEDAWITKWKWCYHPKGYAQRNIWVGGKRTKILMHRVIRDAPDGMEVDHINHDGLDNRKANLRLATNTQNQMNSRKQDNCSSKYKGVYWNRRDKKWKAQIKLNGKKKHLGHFDSEIEAARAYDVAARELFGEYALLNR